MARVCGNDMHGPSPKRLITIYSDLKKKMTGELICLGHTCFLEATCTQWLVHRWIQSSSSLVSKINWTEVSWCTHSLCPLLLSSLWECGSWEHSQWTSCTQFAEPVSQETWPLGAHHSIIVKWFSLGPIKNRMFSFIFPATCNWNGIA